MIPSARCVNFWVIAIPSNMKFVLSLDINAQKQIYACASSPIVTNNGDAKSLMP